jgi:hypothetical protein
MSLFNTLFQAELRRQQRFQPKLPSLIARIAFIARLLALLTAVIVVIDGFIAALFGVDLANLDSAVFSLIFLWFLPLFVLVPVGLIFYGTMLFQIFTFTSRPVSGDLLALTSINAHQLIFARWWAALYHHRRAIFTAIFFYFAVIIWVSLVAYRLELYYDSFLAAHVFDLRPFQFSIPPVSMTVLCLLGSIAFTLLDVALAAAAGILSRFSICRYVSFSPSTSTP